MTIEKSDTDMPQSLSGSDCDPFSTGEGHIQSKEEEELAERRRTHVKFRRNVSLMKEEEFEKDDTKTTPASIDEEVDTEEQEEENNFEDNIIATEENNDDSPFPSLRPFASQLEIDKYEYEKQRNRMYNKHNMFYVPSYEDAPQVLPHIASLRPAADNNTLLKKSLRPESFTYNSWLGRNQYNTSSEHTHIVDDHAVPTPGHICAKPQSSTPPLILPRRVSGISARRRPSIVTNNSTQSLLAQKQYTWIEGVHIRSKNALEVCFEDFGIMRKLPEKSPQECDDRLFTFKAVHGSNKSSEGNNNIKAT